MLKNTLLDVVVLGRVCANSFSISLRRPRALKTLNPKRRANSLFKPRRSPVRFLPPANILLSSCVLTRHLLARPFYSPLVHQLGSDEVAGVFLANTLFCTSRTAGKHRERVADRWYFPGVDNQGSSGRPRPYRRHLSR